MNVEKAVLKFQEQIGAKNIDLSEAEHVDLLRLQADARILHAISKRYKSLFRDKYQSSPIYLRVELILEEVCELMVALANNDEVEILDACVDSVYVIVGTATALGLPFMEAFEEVHRSNMTKSKGAANHDGDKGKTENYSPPDLKSIIERNKF